MNVSLQHGGFIIRRDMIERGEHLQTLIAFCMSPPLFSEDLRIKYEGFIFVPFFWVVVGGTVYAKIKNLITGM